MRPAVYAWKNAFISRASWAKPRFIFQGKNTILLGSSDCLAVLASWLVNASDRQANLSHCFRHFFSGLGSVIHLTHPDVKQNKTVQCSLYYFITYIGDCKYWMFILTSRKRKYRGTDGDPTPFQDISWPELFEHDVLKNCVGESFFKWSVLFFTNGADSIKILCVKISKVYVQVDYTEFMLL